MVKKEFDDCFRRQKDTQIQLELMEQELRDTQLKLQDSLAQLQSVQDERDGGDKERLALLDKMNAAEERMINLGELNQSLVSRSKTLQERYENGDLVSGWTIVDNSRMLET
ncbi:hypothetical protein AX15_002194 [Amanita polypyramis BW_CC]|nr:hypothetical protein AX15_002194 [Amanita polypyramis BW_CC]